MHGFIGIHPLRLICDTRRPGGGNSRSTKVNLDGCEDNALAMQQEIMQGQSSNLTGLTRERRPRAATSTAVSLRVHAFLTQSVSLSRYAH